MLLIGMIGLGVLSFAVMLAFARAVPFVGITIIDVIVVTLGLA